MLSVATHFRIPLVSQGPYKPLLLLTSVVLRNYFGDYELDKSDIQQVVNHISFMSVAFVLK